MTKANSPPSTAQTPTSPSSKHDLSSSPPRKRSKCDGTTQARFPSKMGGILGGLSCGAFMGGILGGLAAISGVDDRASNDKCDSNNKCHSNNDNCDSSDGYDNCSDCDSSDGYDHDDPEYQGERAFRQANKREQQREQQREQEQKELEEEKQELEQISQTDDDVQQASEEDIHDEAFFEFKTKVTMGHKQSDFVKLCKSYKSYRVYSSNADKFIKTLSEFGLFAKLSRFRVGIEETIVNDKVSDKTFTGLVTIILVDEEYDKTLVRFGSLEKLSQYLKENDLRKFWRQDGDGEVLPSFELHQPFTLRPRLNDENQEQNLNPVECYILEVLVKETVFTLFKAYLRGEKKERPTKKEATRIAKDAYDKLCKNKTAFVGLDNINRKEKKFFLIPRECLEEADDAEEAMEMANDPNGKYPGTWVNLDWLSSEGKTQVMTIPPENEEVNPLNIIMGKYAFDNLFGGKRAAYEFKYVLQLDEKDCLLPPNSIGLVKTDFFLPGAAFPLATTVVKLNNTTDRTGLKLFEPRRTELNNLFEGIKSNYNNVSRTCVNGIHNSYHQAGYKEGNYGCHGNNKSGPWVSKKNADQEEVESLQDKFAKLLQTFLNDWIKSIGCKELLCLLNQERATDFENVKRFSDVATGVRRALEFFCGMISEEVSLGRGGETLQDRESH